MRLIHDYRQENRYSPAVIYAQEDGSYHEIVMYGDSLHVVYYKGTGMIRWRPKSLVQQYGVAADDGGISLGHGEDVFAFYAEHPELAMTLGVL